MMDDNGVRADIIAWATVKNCFFHSHLWVVIVYVVVLLLQLVSWQDASGAESKSPGKEKAMASKASSVHVSASTPVHRLSSVSAQVQQRDHGEEINYDALRRVHGDFEKVMRLYIQGFSKGGNPVELELAGAAIMSSLKDVKQYSFIPRDYVESVEDLFAFMTTMHRQQRSISRYGNAYDREERKKKIMVDLLMRMERFSQVTKKYGLPEWK